MSVLVDQIIWIFIAFPLLVNAYIARAKYFDIEKNRVILNNQLSPFYLVKNKAECGLKCLGNIECESATFVSLTSNCTLHYQSASQPLITEISTGALVISPKGTRKPFAMKFDANTLYAGRYLSADRTVLSDVLTSKVQTWPPGTNQLKTYPGVVADSCISPSQKVYYDFRYEYTIVQKYTGQVIAVEHGIADKTTIDTSVYSGSGTVDGWSFPINRCVPDAICLEAWRLNKGYLETAWSPNVVGHYMSGSFAVIVHRIQNKFSLFNKEDQTLVFNFTNVISSADLCSVFSMQGPSWINATITLLSAYDLK